MSDATHGTTVAEVAAFLGRLAPLDLAESWDNVGLLVGDAKWRVERIMTCLTITPVSAAEAIQGRADLIVSHHPLPFHPLRQLTSESTPSRLLLQLVAAEVGVYSAHTAFDSARNGINQQLAEGLGLTSIEPLVVRRDDDSGLGAGRRGKLPSALSLADVAARVKSVLAIERIRVVSARNRPIRSLAVACGSAGEFLQAAVDAGCEALLLGETNFHTCLEAQALGIDLLLPGHFASERFAMESMADDLQRAFPSLTVWASRQETDPLMWW